MRRERMNIYDALGRLVVAAHPARYRLLEYLFNNGDSFIHNIVKEFEDSKVVNNLKFLPENLKPTLTFMLTDLENVGLISSTMNIIPQEDYLNIKWSYSGSIEDVSDESKWTFHPEPSTKVGGRKYSITPFGKTMYLMLWFYINDADQ